jgi:hypothetical protein
MNTLHCFPHGANGGRQQYLVAAIRNSLPSDGKGELPFSSGKIKKEFIRI